MQQRPTSPRVLRARLSHQVLPFSSRYIPYVPIELPTEPDRRTLTPPRVRIRRRAVRQVAVLEVAGRLADVVEDLDRLIQLALANGPRGVTCDLSRVEDADPDAVTMLARVGRHVRDWPGIPVAVACPDPLVREALYAHPLGAHLILAASLFSAISEVLAAPTVSVESRRLAPHPTAPRASRDFVTRTLLDWRLGRAIPIASRVVSGLVSSSSIEAGTDIDISLAWDRGALRLTVLDHGPVLPGQWPCVPDLHSRALTVVAGLSRACGVLPTGPAEMSIYHCNGLRYTLRLAPENARQTVLQVGPGAVVFLGAITVKRHDDKKMDFCRRNP